MFNARLEIIVPVHNDKRPIARAVGSVLSARSNNIVVTVICHNIGAQAVKRSLGNLVMDPRLQLIELLESEPLAAAPRNFGIERSRSAYIGFLDSDDEIEMGAIDAWVAELESSPDLLIGQMSSESAGRIHAPAPRPRRFDLLHPVKDLLNYRTAPLGVMIRREFLISDLSPGYRSGFRTGEDIALGLYLWNTASYVKYSKCHRGYFIHEDGPDRVTSTALSPVQQLAAVNDALRLPVIGKLSLRRRQAIALKLLRTQLLGYLHSKQSAVGLNAEVMDQVANTLEELKRFAPRLWGYLDAAEARLVEAILQRDPEVYVAVRRLVESYPSYRKVVTKNPLLTFAPESPLGRERRSKGMQKYFGG